eukprot:2328448-Alexandrium_andersonii.AAC.1
MRPENTSLVVPVYPIRHRRRPTLLVAPLRQQQKQAPRTAPPLEDLGAKQLAEELPPPQTQTMAPVPEFAARLDCTKLACDGLSHLHAQACHRSPPLRREGIGQTPSCWAL